jgi:hypothetical protein
MLLTKLLDHNAELRNTQTTNHTTPGASQLKKYQSAGNDGLLLHTHGTA